MTDGHRARRLRRVLVSVVVIVALGLWGAGVTVFVRALGSPADSRSAAVHHGGATAAGRGRSQVTSPAAGDPTTTHTSTAGPDRNPASPASSSSPTSPPTSPGVASGPGRSRSPSGPMFTPAVAVGAHSHLADPPGNVEPDPDFLAWCTTGSFTGSLACVEAALGAIDHARALERVAPMVLPDDWDSLTPQQQLFAVTNLERTARGLPPIEAMSTVLDSRAGASAADGSDPGPGGLAVSSWGSNWGDGVGNALEIDYEWMYDDGPGSPNVACPRAGSSGCWGHRHNVLLSLPCRECVMGTGFDNTDAAGYAGWAEILAEATGTTTIEFTWADIVGSAR